MKYLDGSDYSQLIFITLVSNPVSSIQRYLVNVELTGSFDKCKTNFECHFIQMELKIGLTSEVVPQK